MSDDKHKGATKARTPQEISSANLLGNARELIIIHNEERYTLRITANQKLILTK